MFQLYDINGPIQAIPEPTAVTVGVFDGVHQGHQALLAQMEGTRLVVTLTAHPSFVLGRRESEYWLDDPQEHLRLLFEAGAKYVAVLPFSQEVAQMTACEMARWMYERLQMRSLLLGYDSRFGSRNNDDFERLPEVAAELGFELRRGEPFLVNGEPISSSRIRESLANGRVEETATLLGRPFSITGTVLHGRGVGHTLGFPTANIDLTQTRKMLPKDGVYAVRIKNERLRIKNCGMANLGAAPTFGVEKPLLEVHLLDYEGDLYGQTVTVEFSRRLRDIVRFDSIEALQHQLQTDLDQCQKL
jgi:riboflavin kinase/FMN adenylyltransferase